VHDWVRPWTAEFDALGGTVLCSVTTVINTFVRTLLEVCYSEKQKSISFSESTNRVLDVFDARPPRTTRNVLTQAPDKKHLVPPPASGAGRLRISNAHR